MQELLEILNANSFRKTLVMLLVTTCYRMVVSLTGGSNTNTIASGVFILRDLAWFVEGSVLQWMWVMGAV